MVGLMVMPEITKELIIPGLDKTCYQSEKNIYCESMGMELDSIVVTPGGIFGGSPYNKEVCKSENSEKTINLKDLNWERCKRK